MMIFGSRKLKSITCSAEMSFLFSSVQELAQASLNTDVTSLWASSFGSSYRISRPLVPVAPEGGGGLIPPDEPEDAPPSIPELSWKQYTNSNYEENPLSLRMLKSENTIKWCSAVYYKIYEKDSAIRLTTTLINSPSDPNIICVLFINTEQKKDL